MSLADKYQPRRLADLMGNGAIRQRLEDFTSAPRSHALLLSGPPGLGKTSAGLCIANELGCDPTIGYWVYVGAKFADGDLDFLESALRYSPMNGGWRVIQIDECEWISRCPKSNGRLLALLTSHPVRTVFVFTTNFPEKLGEALLDRFEHLPFESGCATLAQDGQAYVNRIWAGENGAGSPPDISTLGRVCNSDGQLSFRRIAVALESMLTEPPPLKLVARSDAPTSLFQMAIERAKPEPAAPNPDDSDADCTAILRAIHSPEAEPIASKSKPSRPASPRPESPTAMLRRLNAYLDGLTVRPSEIAVSEATGLSWSFARRHVLRRFPESDPAPVADKPAEDFSAFAVAFRVLTRNLDQPATESASTSPAIDWSELAELTMAGAC